MELHSYAKRKVAKKWSIDQKRQLVEARINHDGLFTNKPTTSVAPWKKILSLAKLDDYNVFFVRKQWSNMVNKYKQYKSNRLDVIPNGAHDPEEIQKITQEWEFFEPIHRFMSYKTTNLHSYALPITIRLPVSPAAALHDDDGSSMSSPDGLDAYSSDTNYDFNNVDEPNELRETQPNTDHDFYTKKNGLPLNYFADESNDTQESMLVEQAITCNGVTEGMEQVRLHVAGEQIVEMKMEQLSDTEKHVEQVRPPVCSEANAQMPSTSGACRARNCQRRPTERRLSERDRYYRHKRRFNRRLERRFDAILNVFGQIVKAEYPNINVSPLVGAVTQGLTLANNLFKSENENDSADEENESSTDTEQLPANAEVGNEQR
ncbi:uncharacterized protein LOC105208993 [Zeugodacus cucurbitae]|uniref:ETS domain-containing transcription factor ERF n=1 Tax=Zeugodacus cucurbitae TaxID=28588 RepID=A0A0A1WVM4_ZEUCU|nr:uncharacterized protein LOC105208993 [Zeugodacus cucurbitae]